MTTNEDIMQMTEKTKHPSEEQQRDNKLVDAGRKFRKEQTKRKAQLSVSSFLFVTLIVMYAIDYIFGDIFVAYLIFHLPENIPQEILEYIKSILKMYINIHYACKDHVGMILSGCLAWFFKGKMDEKDKQILENKIETLETQNRCSECGREL